MSRHTQYGRPRCPQCKRRYGNTIMAHGRRMGYSLRVIDQRGSKRRIACQECGHSWWSRNLAAAALPEGEK